MNSWIKQYFRRLDALSFEEQGISLKEMLERFEEIRTRYRVWRYRVLCEFFIDFLNEDAQVELSIDYDLDDGLADFWGLSFILEEEHYLPAHWLMESYSSISQSSWAKEWDSWQEGLQKEGIVCFDACGSKICCRMLTIRDQKYSARTICWYLIHCE